jgi:hypothetical protein
MKPDEGRSRQSRCACGGLRVVAGPSACASRRASPLGFGSSRPPSTVHHQDKVGGVPVTAPRLAQERVAQRVIFAKAVNYRGGVAPKQGKTGISDEDFFRLRRACSDNADPTIHLQGDARLSSPAVSVVGRSPSSAWACWATGGGCGGTTRPLSRRLAYCVTARRRHSPSASAARPFNPKITTVFPPQPRPRARPYAYNLTLKEK